MPVLRPCVPALRRVRLALLAGAGAALLAAAAASAQTGTRPPPAAKPGPGEQRVQPLPGAPAKDDKERVRTTSLPAKGLFVGEQLSAAARERLTELIIEAAGLDVEVALVVPTGPWQIDGSGASERDLTPGRLQAVKRFLSERGVDPRRIFVESRIDEKLAEPRLDVQLVGRPGGN